jgi:hypothetical protein
MPPEAVPKVLSMQRQLRNIGKHLTIREAHWMSRLHVLQPDLTLLSIAAFTYAAYEESYQLTGQPCDTSEFDDKLADTIGNPEAFRNILAQLLKDGWNERLEKLFEVDQSK